MKIMKKMMKGNIQNKVRTLKVFIFIYLFIEGKKGRKKEEIEYKKVVNIFKIFKKNL